MSRDTRISRVTRLAALLGAVVLAAAPAGAQTLFITGGTVALGDGSEPAPATIVVRDGRIAAVGRQLAIPPGAQVVDASGQWVTPGIVAGFSRLGLADVDLGAQGADDSGPGGGPFSAALDVVPGINPLYQPVQVSRADGVTRAIVAPQAGSSIFAGQGAVIDLGADMDAVTRARAFQFVELGQAGGDKAGSRLSSFALLRNALREAGDLGGIRGSAGRAGERQGDDIPYEVAPDSAPLSARAERPDDVLLTRFDAAALVPVVSGRQLLLVHVERAIDILNVLALRREFPRLRIALVGASEGWTVADALARSGVWVIASALNDLPARFEMLAATQSNVGRMRAAGVKLAIGMIDDSDTRYARNQRQYAGNLVALSKVPGASGLSWGEAFAMISSRPAEAVGLGGQIGTLKVGARADVVIWSGDPLDLHSAPRAVYIDGVAQPTDNHQTRLRDRYRSLERDSLPEAYRH